MIEPRIYRAAFVPAVLAAVLVMFSLESRPRPVAQGLAADVVFDGGQAAAVAEEIVAAEPDREAGTPGDRATAGRVAAALRASGFAVARQEFAHGGVELVNVIGRRAGESRREIVVVAPRDAAGVPDAASSAADTAALVELARVFEGRPSSKTLVFASVDGTTLGEVGTMELLDELDDPGLVDAVIGISGLGAGAGAPAIAQWGADTARAGIGLQRTVADSLRAEIGPPAPGASVPGQLARLAFPLGIGVQGVPLAAGYDALRISGDGELSDSSPVAPVDPDRLGALGRATLRTIGALDQAEAPPERGPDSYLTVAGQVMPGWVLAVLAGTLILPVLAAGVDALARAGRRRAPVTPWLRWIALGLVPFALGYGVAWLLALAGATPDPPPAPVAPGLYPLDVAALAVLAVVVGVAVGAWAAARRLAGPTERQLAAAAGSGAGVAIALALALAALGLWAVDPFAALLAVPAIHLWALAVLVDPPPAPRARVALVAGGLVLPALLAIYQLFALEVDPLSGAWYLLLMILGGHVGPVAVVVGSLFAVLLACVVAILRRAGADPADGPDEVSTRGPLSYAGPGSLGGTESALRR